MEWFYDFNDLVNTTNALNQLFSVEYSDAGLQFGQVHNKVENIWSKFHPLWEQDTTTNLADYSLVFTNVHIIFALKEGLKCSSSSIVVTHLWKS